MNSCQQNDYQLARRLFSFEEQEEIDQALLQFLLNLENKYNYNMSHLYTIFEGAWNVPMFIITVMVFLHQSILGLNHYNTHVSLHAYIWELTQMEPVIWMFYMFDLNLNKITV